MDRFSWSLLLPPEVNGRLPLLSNSDERKEVKKERIIIVGGLSAGPSAAAKARRINEHAEIHLFEKTSHISYATCGIPYALSGKIKTRDKLMVVGPELLEKRFKVNVHLNEAVISIDPDEHKVYTEGGIYTYDKLIYAAGGTAMTPPIEHLEHFERWAHAKTIEDFDRIMKRGVIDQSDHVTIVGAGLIGLETAENLVHAGKKVTVIEFGNQVLAPWDEKFAKMAEQIILENNIDLKLETYVKAIDPETKDLILNTGERMFTDYLMIGISIKPNTQMLTTKGAAHLPNGALIVNEKMETSLPDIYAAGDCASIKNQLSGQQSWFPMGTHSNKGGRVAGANAVGGDESFKGGYGTAIMKLFDYTIARTGMGPKALKEAGISFQSSLSITGATPSFYPDQKDIITEIYFDEATGKIYGAELLGENGVDKRVDVLSTAIYAGLTIYDLPNLDLAYAPPYSPAKDPVIVAGYVAQNSLNKHFKEVSVLEAAEFFEKTPSSEYTLLDVRTRTEQHRECFIEGAINMPLDELRDRMGELDPTKKVYIQCARGVRGYLASLILSHHGFEHIYHIAGGFHAWKKIIGRISCHEKVG